MVSAPFGEQLCRRVELTLVLAMEAAIPIIIPNIVRADLDLLVFKPTRDKVIILLKFITYLFK